MSTIRSRADRAPARFTLVVPAAVPYPAWGEAATARRRAAIERVHRALDELQRAGVAVQGEVMDGDLGAAARDAVGVYRPTEVLVVSAASQNLDAIRAVARGATVEQAETGMTTS
jgi:hypothetical protein